MSLFISLRKKELSQLNATALILILLLSNSVKNPMMGSNTCLWDGLAAATVLFAINFVLKKLMYKYKKFDDSHKKNPDILNHDVNFNFKALSKLNISSNEFKETMREHGV